jgi:hypothetical protein
VELFGFDLSFFSDSIIVVALALLVVVLIGSLVGILLLWLFWSKRKVVLPGFTLFLTSTFRLPIMLLLRLAHVTDTKAMAIVNELSNKVNEEEFKKIPFSQRAIFLPQCLRNPKCPAPLQKDGIVCTGCGLCGIKDLKKEAEGLGYRVFIMPGGGFVFRMVKKYNIRAALGVACQMELFQAMSYALKKGIVALNVPLLRDGCYETAVNWSEVKRVMRLGAGTA